MRWMIVLAALSATACAQLSEPVPRESMAAAQTAGTAWQDGSGKLLSAAQVDEAYRACQTRMFNPARAETALIVPLDEEFVRLSLSDPQYHVCMHSLGYDEVVPPPVAKSAAG